MAQNFKSNKVFFQLGKVLGDKECALRLGAVHGSLLGQTVHRLHEKGRGPFLLVFPTEKEAQQFCDDSAAFGTPALLFPWWGTVPYRPTAANSPVFGQRVQVLSRMLAGTAPVVATSVRAMAGFLPPPDHIRSRMLQVFQGQRIDPVKMARSLTDLGYLRVSRATVHGEFALRGEVLDIFLPGEDLATRIVFDFEVVNDIKRFDPLTQGSRGSVKEISINPLREVVWSEEAAATAWDHFLELPEARVKDEAALDRARERLGQPDIPGQELWFPLLWSGVSHTLKDYLAPEGTLVLVEYERLYSAAEAMGREYFSSYRKARVELGVLPRPERLIQNLRTIQEEARRLLVLPLLGKGGPSAPEAEVPEDSTDPGEAWGEGPSETTEGDLERLVAPPLEALPYLSLGSEAGRSFFGNISYLKDELDALAKGGYRIFVCADSETQKQRLEHLLKDTRAEVIELRLSSGFSIPDMKVAVVQEHEIFGRKRRNLSQVRKVQSSAIDTFVDLEPGDYVVHVNHGIGLFRGIRRIKASETERDYIELEYANEEFVFVPIEQVNLVQRYIGNQGESPRLDTIGGKSWESRKSKVRKSVEDLAEHLIALYSKRKHSKGFSFPRDGEWQIQFEASFPFEETDDQVRCIQEVKTDMEAPRPMDRLVCGDVGYGKTEIALRAAFKAVSAGKQVAILAPTTILAEQHFENLQERIQSFPIKIGMLSRFVAPKDQKKVIAGLADGSIDMVIGTHRIIQKDVKFKDLGLLVIDEEQRFGVKDKERLKEFKANIDALTLTATPIPRTLHMSLLKIRDMSVLQTPPYNRKPIETHVQAFDEGLVAQAIRREVQRGGQVFYLHNRVGTLEDVRLFIERLVPEVLVETAHGQLSSTELEDIMHRFIHGAFQVLVATTIIENGINIPNVNTIIIDRADMYGVSQLYQLRGRVGRSGRMAWAYLFYPGERALSETAMKRLQIISDHTELGSGFKIALKDLEVRGAGNLLGAEQSGEIVSVGFDLYLRLLDEAIRKLSKEDASELFEVTLELDYTGFVPESYVKEAGDKMEVYKKIASISTELELESVGAEISDRFGPMPDEVLSLLGLAELRILCRKLLISSLKERKHVLEIEFARMSTLNVDKVMRLIQQSNGKVRPDPQRPNVLKLTTDAIGVKEKSEFIRDQLQRLL